MQSRAWSVVAMLFVAVTGFFTLSAAKSPQPNPQADLANRSLEQQRVIQGFRISPVPLETHHRDWNLLGLGSYIVNAEAACNDCHTNPPYADGGDPYMGQPTQINTDGYLAGGVQFGPFTSRNLTPEANGKPAGLTFQQFKQVMRNGHDFDNLHPQLGPLLQVMPWPAYHNMTDHDLRAVYEYLRSIPSIDNGNE